MVVDMYVLYSTILSDGPVIDKWYASTKTCSRCGAVKMMGVSVRRYECVCGMSMDRDLKAAINIRNRGYEIYQKAV